MADYWHHIDDVWVKTPEYAGAGFGNLRRRTPEHLANSRKLLDRGAAACTTDTEQARVRMASLSLEHFEQFMKMRRDHADGRFTTLAADVKRYRERMNALGEQYKDQYAFAQMPWTKPNTINTPTCVRTGAVRTGPSRELYNPLHAELARDRARDQSQNLNATREAQQEERRRILRELLITRVERAFVRPCLRCAAIVGDVSIGCGRLQPSLCRLKCIHF